jgi:hypothetical protein
MVGLVREELYLEGLLKQFAYRQFDSRFPENCFGRQFCAGSGEQEKEKRPDSVKAPGRQSRSDRKPAEGEIHLPAIINDPVLRAPLESEKCFCENAKINR